MTRFGPEKRHSRTGDMTHECPEIRHTSYVLVGGMKAVG